MKKDVVVTEVTYWALVALKDEGHFVSIDEALRPVLSLPAGPRPHLKGFDEHASSATVT